MRRAGRLMQRGLKIIYLHQYFNSSTMSGGSRSYEMARRWVAAGHEVHMITSRREGGGRRKGWDVESVDGLTVHWKSVPYDNTMSFTRRLIAFVSFAVPAGNRARRLHGDAVFATSTPLTIAIPALYATFLRRTPMVFEVRDLWPELPIAVGALRNPITKTLARALEALAYRRSKMIVALSDGMAAGVESRGIPSERVVVAPNACDLDLFGVSDEEGLAFRRRFHWLGDRPFVVYCGTVGVINGVDYLVRLAAEVQARGEDVVFAIIGSGAKLPAVRDLAVELQVLDRNLFILPPVAKSEMPAVLNAATLCTSLFVPVREMQANSANKFFDALAAGRPILINYGGWQARLIESQGIGLVVSASDLSSAADDLIGFLQAPPSIRSRTGMAARELGESQFARDEIADRVLTTIVRATRNR